MKLILLLLTIALFSCQKEDNTPMGTVTFYRSFSGSWNLIVDDIDRGYLEQLLLPPPCEHIDYITMDLQVGTHIYELKNNDGFVFDSEEYFEVKEGCHIQKVIK